MIEFRDSNCKTECMFVREKMYIFFSMRSIEFYDNDKSRQGEFKLLTATRSIIIHDNRAFASVIT